MRVGTITLISNSLYKNNAKQGGGKQLADYPLLCPTEDESRKGRRREREGRKRKRRKRNREKSKMIFGERENKKERVSDSRLSPSPFSRGGG